MIYILRGIAASGKSTWAKEFKKKHSNTEIVGRDYIRLDLFGSPESVRDYWTNYEPEERQQTEDEITKIERTQICKALSLGKDVIVDDTHLRLRYTNMPVRVALDYKSDFKLVDFPIDPEIAIERDSKREMTVGEEVIRYQYESFKGSLLWNKKEMIESAQKLPTTHWIYPTFEIRKDLKCVPSNNNNPNAKPAIVTDIDGNIATRDLQKVTRDYFNPPIDSYLTDHPRKNIIQIVNSLKDSGYTNIILTGRFEKYRKATERWLKEHNVKYDFMLMRPDDDTRKDDEVKYEMLQILEDKYKIFMVTDDRPKVTQMYLEVGLDVLNSRRDVNDVF